MHSWNCCLRLDRRTRPAIPEAVKNSRERVSPSANYPVCERIAFPMRITMMRETIRGIRL